MNNLLKRCVLPVLVVVPMLASSAAAATLAFFSNDWKGTVTSITYDGTGNANGFTLTTEGDHKIELDVHEPGTDLTKLLQRLKDNKTEVQVHDEEDMTYGNNEGDSITE